MFEIEKVVYLLIMISMMSNFQKKKRGEKILVMCDTVYVREAHCMCDTLYVREAHCMCDTVYVREAHCMCDTVYVREAHFMYVRELF